MGVYVYSLRKKKMSIVVEGYESEANLFSFAYKKQWSLWSDAAKRQRLLEERYEHLAEKAWTERKPYVVLCTKPKEGDLVYTNVRYATWADSYDFPGQLVGQLKKIGKKWVVVRYGGK